MKSLMKASAVAVLAIAVPAAAQPVELVTKVLVEKKSAAADGTTRVELVNAARVTPGDRVVYQLRYRNNGKQAARDLVIGNPVPTGLVYAGAAQGSPEPELSIDGKRFGTLAQLGTAGRPASPAQVRFVRWRLTQALAPGTSGQVAYRAVLK